MKVGSLFAGIGGFDLAARWMGWETIWFSEIDPYANAVLAKHWPGVPNLGDITRIDWSTVERPDLLCGGFPCQPHSLAGKRKGSNDARDLWPEYERAIRALRPRYIVGENVPGLFASDEGRFFGTILGALAALGYDAEWEVVPACATGAPHLRERVWIVAYPERHGLQGWSAFSPRWDAESREKQLPRFLLSSLEDEVSAARVWRDRHGIPSRLDVRRNMAVGNTIVPQCAYQIFQAIRQAEEADGRGRAA